MRSHASRGEVFAAECSADAWRGPVEESRGPDAESLAIADGLAAPDPFGVAGIRHLEGGVELAGWLASLPHDQLDAPDQLEVVAAFERVVAWAHARAAAGSAALGRAPALQAIGSAGRAAPRPGRARDVAGVCGAGTEVALRLGMTQRAAQRLIDAGQALGGTLGLTGRALERGDVRWEHAREIVDGLAHMPWQVAHAVEDVVLDGAGRRTPTQVRQDVARALAEVDPQDAQERHERAVARRRVDRPRPLPDGMAAIRAVLPAEDAVRVDAVLQGAAVAGRRAGDVRSTDQLRADALTAMATQAWAAGHIGPASDAILGAPTAGSGTVDVDPDRAALGATTGAGVDVGGGGDADADAGALAETGACADAVAAGSLTGRRQSADRAADTWRVAQVGGRTQIRVTVGLATLIGLDDRPAELAGYGPIGADVARRLAQDGTWRRLLTDPADGAVVDVGRRRYRPPADLAEIVRARHPECLVPTCRVPAHACDVDHTVPFAAGGTTELGNLGPLCRRHHREKSAGLLRIAQPDRGTFEIRTSAGQVVHTTAVRPPGVPWDGASSSDGAPPRAGAGGTPPSERAPVDHDASDASEASADPADDPPF